MKPIPVKVIAEVGVNHNGDLNLAKKLVYHAKKAGADIVKFQSFDAMELALPDTKTADYQRAATNQESQQKLLSSLELSIEDHVALHAYCAELDIEFLSTAFDEFSLEAILKIGLKRIKIPSGEITNVPLLEKIAGKMLPILMSTGMCTMEEIETALKTLVSAGADKNNIIIMHCTSNYPATDEELNLRALSSIQRQFNVQIGYSDHSIGNEASLAAIALGAVVIEKHITLDKTMDGPDHLASMEIDEFYEFVKSIRRLEIALGSNKKVPSISEKATSKLVRKSIVSRTIISKGDVFSEENLGTKRPGDGLSAINWHKLIGKTASNSYLENQQIEPAEL